MSSLPADAGEALRDTPPAPPGQLLSPMDWVEDEEWEPGWQTGGESGDDSGDDDDDGPQPAPRRDPDFEARVDALARRIEAAAWRRLPALLGPHNTAAHYLRQPADPVEGTSFAHLVAFMDAQVPGVEDTLGFLRACIDYDYSREDLFALRNQGRRARDLAAEVVARGPRPGVQ